MLSVTDLGMTTLQYCVTDLVNDQYYSPIDLKSGREGCACEAVLKAQCYQLFVTKPDQWPAVARRIMSANQWYQRWRHRQSASGGNLVAKSAEMTDC